MQTTVRVHAPREIRPVFGVSHGAPSMIPTIT